MILTVTSITRNCALAIDHIRPNLVLHIKVQTGLIKTDISNHFARYFFTAKYQIDLDDNKIEIEITYL